ncbi:hypothetical protein [Helicobacter cetorum]|uniref:hypothetical protein n=1 Tax=Helicobacter cetorum TaxID=138563 RepID=UPI000CF15825|nr:hypothetical protein [Helicobacter cetorum]
MDKKKNASELTHNMKNEHGSLAKACERADMQQVFKELYNIAKEESEGYRMAAEGYRKALDAEKKADELANTLRTISHNNNIIDVEIED